MLETDSRVRQLKLLLGSHIGFENELEDDSDEFKSEGWRSIFNIDNVIAKIKSFNTPKFLGLERRVLDELRVLQIQQNTISNRSDHFGRSPQDFLPKRAFRI